MKCRGEDLDRSFVECAAQSAEVERLRQEARRRDTSRPADAARAERELALAAELWRLSPACHGDDIESRAIGEILERLELMTTQA